MVYCLLLVYIIANSISGFWTVDQKTQNKTKQKNYLKTPFWALGNYTVDQLLSWSRAEFLVHYKPFLHVSKLLLFYIYLCKCKLLDCV